MLLIDQQSSKMEKKVKGSPWVSGTLFKRVLVEQVRNPRPPDRLDVNRNRYKVDLDIQTEY